jgi:cyclopropane-fatty-acyl-phospholipid synthase
MLQAKLESMIRVGRLTVVLPGGKELQLGSSKDGSPPLVIRLRKALTPYKIAFNPDLYLGEAYMDGDLVMEQGSIYDLLELGMRNEALQPTPPAGPFKAAGLKLLAAVKQHNSKARSRHNVSHHYDISNDLYRLFLDDDLQYSCAYFSSPDLTIDEAQEAKKRHIAAKLLLQPGQRVLDIGCGWGGLALGIAQQADVSVLGFTLSTEQLALARQRAAKLGLQDRVKFELIDYRDLQGEFDRIVSVGMFEHVGTPNYPDYFGGISRLLKPDGVALVHSIGRKSGISKPNGWIDKYIFPGGYIPSFSEVIGPIENSGLWMTDLEILRLHYAETLRHWRERFMARRGALASRYDDRFCRMWEFYLAACEACFRQGGLMVFQVQLARSIEAVPLTRDYMVDAERMLPLAHARAAE